MDLSDFRVKIDEVDSALVELFLRRMNIAAEIAAFKKANGIPVLDSSREEAKLRQVSAMAPEEMQEYVRSLYGTIFELSRAHQTRLLDCAGKDGAE